LRAQRSNPFLRLRRYGLLRRFASRNDDRGKNEDVDVEIVAYGPDLHMLRGDSSPVQDRIKRLKDMVFPGKIQFSACNNTKQGMEKAEGHAIPIVPEATVVPSGVVRLMELQEKGWSYLRP